MHENCQAGFRRTEYLHRNSKEIIDYQRGSNHIPSELPWTAGKYHEMTKEACILLDDHQVVCKISTWQLRISSADSNNCFSIARPCGKRMEVMMLDVGRPSQVHAWIQVLTSLQNKPLPFWPTEVYKPGRGRHCTVNPWKIISPWSWFLRCRGLRSCFCCLGVARLFTIIPCQGCKIPKELGTRLLPDRRHGCISIFVVCKLHFWERPASALQILGCKWVQHLREHRHILLQSRLAGTWHAWRHSRHALAQSLFWIRHKLFHYRSSGRQSWGISWETLTWWGGNLRGPKRIILIALSHPYCVPQHAETSHLCISRFPSRCPVSLLCWYNIYNYIYIYVSDVNMHMMKYWNILK